MKNLEKIKEALRSFQRIPGVKGCWLEADGDDIVHVYAVTHEVDYDLDTRIFQEFAAVEQQFPEVSFEFLITSRTPSPQAEIVFFSPRVSSSVPTLIAS